MTKATKRISFREDTWGIGNGYRTFTVTTHSKGDGEYWQDDILIRGDFTGLDVRTVREMFDLSAYSGGAGREFAHPAPVRRKTSRYMLFSQSGGLDI